LKIWKNITIFFKCRNLYDAADKLSQLDIISITIKEKDDVIESNWFDNQNNILIPTSKTHNLILLLDEKVQINSLLKEIKLTLELKNKPSYSLEEVKDRDWLKYSQSNFQSIYISNSLRIVPPWESQSQFSGKTIIIQPGTGFGTGTHPTTQLCLKNLKKTIKKNDSLLDYGSGSGILSFGALLYGANHVEGIEIDTKAIINAEINNKLNNTSIPFHSSEKYILKKDFDIIIANILSSILIDLSPNFKKLTKKILILSGVLKKQADQVINAYSNWIDLIIEDEMDDWVLLQGKL